MQPDGIVGETWQTNISGQDEGLIIIRWTSTEQYYFLCCHYLIPIFRCSTIRAIIVCPSAKVCYDSEPDRSTAPTAWCKNFCLCLSVFSAISPMYSFGKHLVLVWIKSFPVIFRPPCVIVRKTCLTFMRRLSAYNVPKWVIWCVITALTYIQYCAIIGVVVCRSVSVKCMWEILAEI